MSDRPPRTPPPVDPDAPATAEEIAEAARLRDALEARSPDELVRALTAAWSPGPLDDAAHAAMLEDLPASEEEVRVADALRDELDRDPVAIALRAAWRPGELDHAEHARIVAQALAPNVTAMRRRRRLAVPAIATSTLALAAGVLLWLTSAPPTEAPLARSRSTQPLFEEPFRAGESSARIDRIALARSADYRDNRFAKWGVK
jgi:hypothetical protein